MIEPQFLLSGLQGNGQQLRGIERFQEEAGRAVADAVHRRLKTAVCRDHDDFDLGMRAFDVVQEVRSGTIGQFQVQRDEIDAVVVEDGQSCACILRDENVEVLLEDLCEGRTGAASSSTIRTVGLWSVVSGTRVEGIVSLVSLSPLPVKRIA